MGRGGWRVGCVGVRMRAEARCILRSESKDRSAGKEGTSDVRQGWSERWGRRARAHRSAVGATRQGGSGRQEGGVGVHQGRSKC